MTWWDWSNKLCCCCEKCDIKHCGLEWSSCTGCHQYIEMIYSQPWYDNFIILIPRPYITTLILHDLSNTSMPFNPLYSGRCSSEKDCVSIISLLDFINIRSSIILIMDLSPDIGIYDIHYGNIGSRYCRYCVKIMLCYCNRIVTICTFVVYTIWLYIWCIKHHLKA